MRRVLDEDTIGSVVYEIHPSPQGGKILFCRNTSADFDRKPANALYNAGCGGSVVYTAEWTSSA